MRLDPETSLYVLDTGGRICGYSITVLEPDIGRAVAGIGVTRECRQWADDLVGLCISAASADGLPVLHLAVQHDSVEPADIYRAKGVQEIMAHLEMSLSREDAGGLQDDLLPDNYSIRQMRSPAEALLLTRVQNKVFDGHWGFSKNSPDEVLARLDLPVTGPENVLFIESDEGDVAAYVWTALEWENDRSVGYIWMTGVVPEFRQSGLGKAVVHAGIKRLFASGAAEIHLEVIAENRPAVAIYEAMGFRPIGRIAWHELKLR
jgi:mycothiol synthase